MNNCTLIGRFVTDPDIKNVGKTKLVTFSLAVEEYRKDKEGNKKKRVDFFDFEAWDSGAETINELCRKGDVIAVSASARQQKWTNSDNEYRQKVIFRVQNFRVFAERDNG
tara:strand:+ start:5870 stop:6199 length:330 start_codon:yes stop_codon:yes gene_type:complete